MNSASASIAIRVTATDTSKVAEYVGDGGIDRAFDLNGKAAQDARVSYASASPRSPPSVRRGEAKLRGALRA